MSADTATLRIRVESDGVTRARNELGRYTKEAQQAETATGGLMKMMGRLVSVYALWRGAMKVGTTLMEFERTMSGVKAVLGGTADEMKMLEQEARRLGETTRYSAAETAEGMRQLAQAGFTANQVVAAMPGMLDLATAGELGLAEAADIASASLAGFTLQASESTRVADVLAAAAAGTNTNVAQLGDAMKYVAPIANAMEISIEQTAAAVGVLSNAGLQGSMAGTGLRQVLASLATPTAEAERILRAYGISLEQVNPAANDLVDILALMREKGITATDALLIAGDRGGNALTALIEKVPDLQKLNVQMDEAAGRAKQMAFDMGDNLAGDLVTLSSTFDELILKSGDTGLGGALRTVTQYVTELVRAANDLATSGVFKAGFEIFTFGVMTFKDELLLVADAVKSVIDWLLDLMDISGSELVQNLMMIPATVRSVFQMVGTSIGYLWLRIEADVIDLVDSISARLTYIVDMGKAINASFSLLANPATAAAGVGMLFASEEAAASKMAKTLEHVTATADVAREAAISAFRTTMDGILLEWAATDKLASEKIEKFRAAWDEFERLRAEREANKGKPTTPAAGGGVVTGSAPADATGMLMAAEFEQLKESLTDQEQLVAESYERRKELILRNTTEGSELQIELLSELEKRVRQESIDAREYNAEQLQSQYSDELVILEDALADREITEAEFHERSLEAWKRYQEKLIKLDSVGARTVTRQQLEMHSSVLAMAGDIAGQLSTLVKENEDAAKAMFIASKAISIAQAIVYTELAATKALAEGGMYAGVPMATVIRSFGYASVALMAATSIMEYRSQFEHGGMIPSGKWGVTQEAGAELVQGPAVVTSARTTADLLSGAEGSSKVTVNVNNYAGADVDVKERQTPDGTMIDLVIKRAKSEIAREVQAGGTPITRALENSYRLRRGAA